MGSTNEKNRGQKSRDTAPLKSEKFKVKKSYVFCFLRLKLSLFLYTIISSKVLNTEKRT